MANLYTRDDRLYLNLQASWDTIDNSAGAADVAATDACKHESFTAEPTRVRLQPPDKESTAFLGFRDLTIAGKFAAATPTVVTPLFSASAAGVEPDNGPLFESAFGKKTIVADTSVTYAANNSTKYLNEAAPKALEAWLFNTGAKRGKVAWGSIVNRLVIAGGQDYATVTADMLSRGVLTQDRFAAASTAEKGGLTAWPTEPASQTYTGSPMVAFTCTLTLDGNVYSGVRNWSIAMNMNRQFRADKYAVDGTEYLPSDLFEMMPEITFDFSLHSTDSANLSALIAKIAARTAFDASLVIGNVAGGIYTFALNNLIMPDAREAMSEDGDDRKAITVRGLRAQATSTSVRDEITLALT